MRSRGTGAAREPVEHVVWPSKWAGWPEGRRIDPTGMLAALRAAGYPTPPAVREFLSRFGGLSFTNPKGRPPAASDWHFDVYRTVEWAVPGKVSGYYGARAGAELCPVGGAAADHLLLMMDRTGRVFGGYDEFFVALGRSGAAAIENLAQGRILGSPG